MKLSDTRSGFLIGAALIALASPVLAQTAPKAPSNANGAAAAPAAPDPSTLKRAQVDALLATPSKVVFLDVRRADEVSDNGGFPVFLNIQLADLDKYLAYIPKDRTIVAVSNHAHRALTAENLLKKNGFKVAGIVGVLDYADEGGVLVGKKPPAKVAGAPAAPGQ